MSMLLPPRSAEIVILSGRSMGLENDAKVMQQALGQLMPTRSICLLLGRDPWYVKTRQLVRLGLKKLSMQPIIFIHMEEVQGALLWLSRCHYLVPNQEWFRSHTAKAVQRHQKISLLCKTQAAVAAFAEFAGRRQFLGFSSLDREDKRVSKDFGRFLHLAGKSEQKGTLAIIAAWRANPAWPNLTLKTSVESHIHAANGVANIRLIRENLTDAALKQLLNSHGVHLCPSEMEGFGHYIVEALSTGAIVLSTDAPPMNELVLPHCGFLVKAEPAYQQYRAVGYHLLSGHFCACIEQILRLTPAEQQALSVAARERYLQIQQDFMANLDALLPTHSSLVAPRTVSQD